MSKFNEERVLSVHHWTDTLFSFRTTRDPSFRFRNGEFTMIGHRGRGPSAAARLQRRLGQLRGGAGVLLDQGAERPADLEAAAPQGRRPDHGRQEADRHAGARQPDAGQAPLPARHRHRARAVHVDHQGPGDLRALREGRARPWLPAGPGTRLWRDHHAGPAEPRVPRRDHQRAADLLSHRHPRAVPQLAAASPTS